MFFRMLKKDLCKNKGLNIILFVFITIASILAVTGVIQVYVQLSGRPYTKNLCNASDLVIVNHFKNSERDSKVSEIKEWMKDQKEIKNSTVTEMIPLEMDNIQMDHIDIKDISYMYYNSKQMICKQPNDMDLLYDVDDTPFYIENGSIALSANVKDATGINIGDKVRLTTQMGYTYEFTVSHFYKLPINPLMVNWMISDADYDYIAQQSPYKDDVMKIKLTDGTDPNIVINRYNSLEKDNIQLSYYENLASDSNYTVIMLISAFLVVISIFMLLIILITIRFMMISSIKEEEKELGMMRAIGVDSFSYRWLFAAKYIAFSVVGGIVGVTTGIYLSKILMGIFCKNTILPAFTVIISISVITSLVLMVLIVLFTLLVMRRIRKISVIDAIHGEHRGERFGKMTNLFLNKRKRISVPLYLAVSDLCNKFKRYIFLVVAYSLGVMIILSTVHLKSTILSKEYMKQFLQMNLDFDYHFTEEMEENYIKRTGSYGAMLDLINKEMKDAGIPAETHYDYKSEGIAFMPDGHDKKIQLVFGDVNTKEFEYRAGGTAPTLENEIALSFYTAKLNKLKIGDQVEITTDEYTDDQITTEKVKRKYIITGYIDCFEGGEPIAIMGDQYDKAEKQSVQIVRCDIHALAGEKAGYIKKMKELYGEDIIMTFKESTDYGFSYLIPFLDALEYIMSISILFVLVLITTLYSSVLLSEETNSVAMLKSTGFDNRDIKKWQLYRMIFILIISIVIGNILIQTVGEFITNKILESFGNTGFRFVINVFQSYVLVTVLVFIAGIGTTLLRLKSINKIKIWNIRED